MIAPQALSAATSGFLASFVEGVEALTIVLAAGAARGYRGALAGAATGLLALAGLVWAVGPALTVIPLALARLVIGALLLGFGLRWLRKAVLRAAGRLKLRDEAAIYAATTARLAGPHAKFLDPAAFHAALHMVLLEGIEVAFILLALTAAHPALRLPATFGALAALAGVILLGLAIHRPLARVPENLIKLAAGTLLSSFGAFLLGEALHLPWPGGDDFLPVLIALAALAVLAAIAVTKRKPTVSSQQKDANPP